jgi:hypothetical protein
MPSLTVRPNCRYGQPGGSLYTEGSSFEVDMAEALNEVRFGVDGTPLGALMRSEAYAEVLAGHAALIAEIEQVVARNGLDRATTNRSHAVAEMAGRTNGEIADRITAMVDDMSADDRSDGASQLLDLVVILA